MNTPAPRPPIAHTHRGKPRTLALVSIGVGWFVAGLAYFATRTNDR